MSTKTISLSIDSQLENSRLVGFAIRGLCDLLTLGDAQIAQIELAVVEAVNRVILHAYSNEAGNDISLDISITAEQLEIQIYDSGIALEPGQLERQDVSLPQADDPLSWDDADNWLAILHQTMDQVNYYSVGGLNTLVLQKHLAPST